MPKTDALRGAYCPLIVPFRDGKIDYDTYGELIERQIAQGTHGLLVNATSGEPTMLTLEERAENQRASQPNGAGVAGDRAAGRQDIGRDWPDLTDGSALID